MTVLSEMLLFLHSDSLYPSVQQHIRCDECWLFFLLWLFPLVTTDWASHAETDGI